MMKRISKINFSNKIYILLSVIFISSCSSLSPYKVPILQGNIFEDEEIENLSQGLSKEQVQFIFGTSLIKDPYHSQRWDYFYSIKVGDNLLEEKKLTIFFNDNDLVDSWIIEDISK